MIGLTARVFLLFPEAATTARVPMQPHDQAAVQSIVQKLVQPLAKFIRLEQEGAGDLNYDFQELMKVREEIRDTACELGLAEGITLVEALIPEVEKQMEKSFAFRYETYKRRIQLEQKAKEEAVKRLKNERDNRFFFRAKIISAILLTVLLGIISWPLSETEIFGKAGFLGALQSAETFGLTLLVFGKLIFLILACTAFGWVMGGQAGPLIAALLLKGREKTENLIEMTKPIEFHPGKVREEQNWVWLCQRCEATLPYLGENGVSCERCGNHMTRVMGRWELK
jgi:hypothetical protein